jgi:hypothetical protein
VCESCCKKLEVINLAEALVFLAGSGVGQLRCQAPPSALQ